MVRNKTLSSVGDGRPVTKVGIKESQRKKSGSVPYQAPQSKRTCTIDASSLMNERGVPDLHEHDILIRFETLLELDKHIHGNNEEKAYAARQVRNDLLSLIEGKVDINDIKHGIPLPANGHKRGRLYLEKPKDIEGSLDPEKYVDHAIILSTLGFQNSLRRKKEESELITDDKMMRLIALVLGVRSSKLKRMSVSEESQKATGVHRIQATFADELEDGIPRNPDGSVQRFVLNHPNFKNAYVNEFVEVPYGNGKFRRLQIKQKLSDTRVAATFVRHYANKSVNGIRALDHEQEYALNLLMDPDIKLVIIEGPAGCGKNILTLAAAFQQLKDGLYDEVIATRDPVPESEQLGFKPGDTREKLAPWMGGITDNEKFLAKRTKQTVGKQNQPGVELVELSDMRGRSLHRTFSILDENQNSTREQIRLFLTRIAEDSKAVILGNFKQNARGQQDRGQAFARLIEVTREWPLAGHIVLNKVHRGPIPDFIEKHY